MSTSPPVEEEPVQSPRDNDKNSDCKRPKKRFKPLKSCAFCRKRKLKCDKQKPRCSSCARRNLPVCVYIENAFTAEMVQNGTVSSLQLLERIRTLEKQLADKETKNMLKSINESRSNDYGLNMMSDASKSPLGIPGSIDTLSPDSVSGRSSYSVNPYLNHSYLQAKSYGRVTLYGPTSLRTYILNQNSDFAKKYQSLWVKIKEERQKYKKKHEISLLRELKTVETLPISDHGSLLADICKELPSYAQIAQIVSSFFDTEETNELNQILDKQKVMKDFADYFITGNRKNDDGELLIEKLVPDNKYNLYKLGIILMILCIKHFFEEMPASIEKYFIFIAGLTSGKTMYIEKAQFLVMYCYYRTIYSSRGDTTHLLNLLFSLTGLVQTLALNTDLEHTYGNMQNLVGSIDSLKKLYVWILYLDYWVCFEAGRPLLLQYKPNELKQIKPSKNQYDSYYKRMIGFLSLARPMMNVLFNSAVDPPLNAYCKLIYQFIEDEFRSIGNCRNLSLVESFPLNDLRVLTLALATLETFYSMRIKYRNEDDVDLKDDSVHCLTVSLSLTISLLVRCFNIDKIKNKEFFSPNCPHLPPYMALSISISNNLFARSISILSVFLYFKVTLFEDNPRLLSRPEEVGFVSPGLRRGKGKSISVLHAFQEYSDVFDNFLSMENNSMKNIMLRSYIFFIQISLEKVNRKIIDKVIEYRKKTEETMLRNDTRPTANEYVKDNAVMHDSATLNQSITTGSNELNNSKVMLPSIVGKDYNNNTYYKQGMPNIMGQNTNANVGQYVTNRFPNNIDQVDMMSNVYQSAMLSPNNGSPYPRSPSVHSPYNGRLPGAQGDGYRQYEQSTRNIQYEAYPSQMQLPNRTIPQIADRSPYSLSSHSGVGSPQAIIPTVKYTQEPKSIGLPPLAYKNDSPFGERPKPPSLDKYDEAQFPSGHAMAKGIPIANIANPAQMPKVMSTNPLSQAMAEEFWQNYNLGWEKLVSQTDPSSFI